jgi:hypothetical protein
MAIGRELLDFFGSHIFQYSNVLFSPMGLVVFNLSETGHIHQRDQVIEALYKLVQRLNFLFQFLYLLILTA